MADELDGIAEKHVAEIDALEVMQTGVKGGELKRETRMGLAESAGASLSQEGLSQYLDDLGASMTEALATKKDDVMVKRGDLSPEMRAALDEAYAKSVKPTNLLDDILSPAVRQTSAPATVATVQHAAPGKAKPTATDGVSQQFNAIAARSRPAPEIRLSQQFNTRAARSSAPRHDRKARPSATSATP